MQYMQYMQQGHFRDFEGNSGLFQYQFGPLVLIKTSPEFRTLLQALRLVTFMTLCTILTIENLKSSTIYNMLACMIEITR